MFDGRFRSQAEQHLRPIGANIQRTGVRADHLTVLGVAMAAASAVSLGPGPLKALVIYAPPLERSTAAEPFKPA